MTEYSRLFFLLCFSGIDKEVQPTVRLSVNKWQQQQFAQGLHLSVQIDIGMNRFYLLLIQERYLPQILYAGGIYVDRVFMQQFQLLEVHQSGFLVKQFVIRCIFLYKVIPGILFLSCCRKGNPAESYHKICYPRRKSFYHKYKGTAFLSNSA